MSLRLLTLLKRAGNAKLPLVNIVDMKEEVKKGNGNDKTSEVDKKQVYQDILEFIR